MSMRTACAVKKDDSRLLGTKAPSPTKFLTNTHADSFPKCQTSFFCASCKKSYVLAENLRDGQDFFSALKDPRPVAAVVSTCNMLSAKGALHPQRILCLEARKRFYRCVRTPSRALRASHGCSWFLK